MLRWIVSSIFVFLSCPATAGFLDTDSFSGVDVTTLREVTVHLEGIDKKYRALGDMLLTDEDTQRAFSGTLWPHRRIIFAFDASVSDQNQASFWDACKFWENGTRIHCVQRTSESDFILVRSVALGGGVAGQSVVGWHKGEHTMELAQWDQYTLVHEIGHAIGKAHEHQRSDASKYLTINKANADPDQLGNLLPLRHTQNFVDHMDFNSVMFYWTDAFAKPPGFPVIVLNEEYKSYQDVIGHNSVPSADDLKDVATAYAKVAD
jgi:hypothetical protein